MLAGLRATARKGRGGGRSSALLPLFDDDTASPASRRLASARSALAPKCDLYSLTGPNHSIVGSGQRAIRSKKHYLQTIPIEPEYCLLPADEYRLTT
jgi:hypothetical protein